MKVKICGITRLEDALAAARLGADALGFNFWPGSKRFIAPRRRGRDRAPAAAGRGRRSACSWTPRATRCSRAVAASGVRRRPAPRGRAARAVRLAPAPGGEGDPRGATPSALAALAAYDVLRRSCSTRAGPGFGGSGRTFDWELAAEAARAARVFLAGGLTPENVGEAVTRVRPYGVDVASGVELMPGVKDEEQVRRFVQAAKEAAR